MKQELNTYEQVKEKALRLLEFRAHSEKELCDKLRRLGAQSDMIEDVIYFCREYGFLNDAEYAKLKARDLCNLKKYGKHRIEQELRAKGISSDLIYEAVCELEFDENELLMQIEKKLKGNFEKKNIDKCIRYFMYRGYDLSQIKACIEEVKGKEYDI